MPWLHIFDFPKIKFTLGNLHSKECYVGKQTRRKMKEVSMHDEKMKSVLKNSYYARYRTLSAFCIRSNGNRNPLIISQIGDI